ncbi:MAG: ABC transporter permease [Acidobacteria bacterium]|nr:ABC transporter permease [Acidobacteriota bacterium]
MVNRLIVSNLVMRPVRTLVSITAVAVEVILIIMVVGLTHGTLQDSVRRTQGVGADIMVQPQTTSVFMGFSGAPMPIQVGDKVAEIPNVRAVAPVMIQASSGSGITLIYGIDPESFRAVSGGFRFLEGHDLQNPDEVLVDDIYARSQEGGVRVGDTITLLNHPFRLAGVVEHGKGARIFVRLDTLQDLMGSVGKASVFFVKLAGSASTAAVVSDIQRLLPGYQIRNMEEYLSLMTVQNIPGLGDFINVMIGLAVAIGLLVIFITMYSTIVERTREIGILKSMGASNRYIVEIVLRETTFLTVFGIGAGIGLSYLVRRILLHSFPSLNVLITGDWMLRAALIAFAASLLGACYPAFRATRQDAIEALAYE